MIKKLFLYTTIFLLFITSAFASNTVTLYYYNQDGDVVNNVETSVFECTDSTCTALTGTSTSDRVAYDNSGSTNYASVSIPAVSSTTWFVAYAFAEATDSYLPQYQTFYVTGDGWSGATDITLEKKDICRSTIQSFSVTNSVAPNEPIEINVEAALEADTYSAFILNDAVYPWAYDSSETTEYQDWYSSDVEVELTITKEIGSSTFRVYTDTSSVSILAEESQNIAFSYTPTTQGTYTATVSTYVTDGECASSEEQSSSEQFEVVEEEDTGYCYTNIDDLAIAEIEDGTVTELYTGETYTVTFNKLSNDVASDGSLSALETALDIAVYDQDANLDYSFSDTDGNTNTDYEQYSFAWTPISEGDNTIVVHGIANDCPHVTNNRETETLTIYVNGEDVEPELIPPVAIADGGQLWGFTLSETPIYTVHFDGSASYDTDGSIVSYTWDFGDGTSGSGASITHTYTGLGPYTVTLTVIDNDGLTDSDTLPVRRYYVELPMPDFDPNADCGGSYSATLGDSIAFDGTGSEFGGGAVTYAWDFGDGSSSTQEDPVYTYNAQGTYTVTLTVTDDEGDTDTCTTTATVTAFVINSAPSVNCNTIPITGTTNEEITLQVAATDSDGTVTEYDWDFGDGNIDSTTTDSTTHTYTTAGDYITTVVVSDDSGATGICSQMITVTDAIISTTNNAPVADCSLIPTSAEVLEDIYFDGSASTDSDGTIVNYQWDFGYNGIGVNGPTLFETLFGYAEAGTYIITLTVTDDLGATGSCTALVDVTEAPVVIIPEDLIVTIIADTTTGTVPLDVCFTADVAGGIEPYTYDWDFETDGTIDSTDAAPCTTYTGAGTFTVSLKVKEADGQTAHDTEVITVGEDFPAIAVATVSPDNGEPTLWVHFSSVGSSGNEPLSYYWTFSEGGSSTLANPGHYYYSEGTYSATLTVTDADGDTDSDTVTVTVSNALANLGENHYYIDGIALSNDGRVNAGDDLELWVSAENIAGIDKSNVNFNAIIQELGVYETSGEFDLEAEDTETKVLSIHIPEDTEPGIYYIRITVSDDDVHRVIYRDIIVS